MRTYIVNLTDNLINKHRFHAFIERKQNWDSILRYIKTTLEVNDVHEMSPETLGRIMGSLEMGDVMASKKDLTENLYFAGNCAEMFRELVALCLAYVIRERFERESKWGWGNKDHHEVLDQTQ